MKKRLFTLCLACLMAASMSACGDSSTSESSRTSAKKESSSAVSESSSESKPNSENTSESNSQADSSSQESNDKKKVKKQTSDEVLLKVENWGNEGDEVGNYTIYKYELDSESGNYICWQYKASAPYFEEEKEDRLYEYDKELRKVSYDRLTGQGLEKLTLYKYEFDEVGNVIKQSEYEPDNPDRASYYTTYEYDDEGNCIKEELYRGSSIQTSYTREYENGVLSKETQLTGSGDVVFISEFDEKGHVVKDSRGTYTYEYYGDGGYKQTSDRGDYKIYNNKEQLIEEKEKNNFLFKYIYGKIS